MAAVPMDPAGLSTQEVGRVLAEAAVELGATPREVEKVPEVRAVTAAKAGLDPEDEALTVGAWSAAVVLVTKAFELAARSHQRRQRATGPLPCCQRCAQPLGFVRTVAARSMPIDPVPHPMGNVVLVNHGQSRLVAEVLGLDELPTPRTSYRPHFATCPAADEFTRRREAQSVTQAVCSTCGGRLALALLIEGRSTHLGDCEEPRAQRPASAPPAPSPRRPRPPSSPDDDQPLLFPDGGQA